MWKTKHNHKITITCRVSMYNSESAPTMQSINLHFCCCCFFPSTSDYLGKEAVMSMNSLTQTAVPGCNLQSAARSFSFNRDG